LALGLSLSGLILTDTDPSSVPPVPVAPPPQNSSAGTNSASDPFRLIARNNIFDQSRVGPRQDGERPRPPPTRRVSTLTCQGSSLYDTAGVAFFSGSEVSPSREYKVGDSVGDLKLARITLYTVTLTNASSNTFVLPTDPSKSLRRDDNGPWHSSEYIAGTPASGPEGTRTTSVASPSTPAAGGVSSVEEMLRKRREAAN